ncbi:hypothetical protein [Ureibacillus acetophenoni]|uniref:Uncharacterized protein n=1 Tax=Ureibacillus acetophenoni TaxID=614649 RepID=A0A285UTE3_9BACL|nr:hypothetical protein [Ureibacillus acetophenoni]SOC44648.1 hypothetical protein SAMN05877842_12232 [Ureibacillus acetophenoni]
MTTVTDSEFYPKIDINGNSALYKAYGIGEVQQYVADLISEYQFRANYERYMKIADDLPDHAKPAEPIIKVYKIMDRYIPSRKNDVVEDCKLSKNYFLELKKNIEADIYPKWEVQLRVKRYATNDGGYIDIAVGGWVTAKYTPTGQKIMM